MPAAQVGPRRQHLQRLRRSSPGTRARARATTGTAIDHDRDPHPARRSRGRGRPSAAIQPAARPSAAAPAPHDHAGRDQEQRREREHQGVGEQTEQSGTAPAVLRCGGPGAQVAPSGQQDERQRELAPELVVVGVDRHVHDDPVEGHEEQRQQRHPRRGPQHVARKQEEPERGQGEHQRGHRGEGLDRILAGQRRDAPRADSRSGTWSATRAGCG